MKTTHQLKINSLHDANAQCSCGKWNLVATGERTREQITSEHALHAAPAQAQHSPLPWSLSGQAGDQYIMAKQPEGRIRVAEVFTLYDREYIVRACNNAQRLADALRPFVEMPFDQITSKQNIEASEALAEWSKSI